MTSSDSDRNPVEQLAEEFAERYRRGERPSLTEFVNRYPEWAEDIRDLFPALVKMEQLKPAPADGTGPYDVAGGPAPDQIGDYRILREVGRGGMGVVYEAEQLSLGRHVALKVLPTFGLINSVFLERFRREAKAAARLHHTNIVPVFGVGDCDGLYYYAMQFIQGEGLDKVLHDLRRFRDGTGTMNVAPTLTAGNMTGSVAEGLWTGRFVLNDEQLPNPGTDSSPSRDGKLAASLPGSRSELSGRSTTEYFRSVARVGRQVAEALAYAHKQGILHRDIKPSNLLLDQQGAVWVTDFGLAKAEGTDDLTHTGDIVGTLRFMAPERFDGASLPQSDVYGLGLTLYEMLSLRPAFEDANRARLIERILHDPPAPPRKLDPRIPRDLETIVLKAIAKDPAARYASAERMAEDLQQYLSDRPIKARRTQWYERTWRWCRRNPAVATLLTAVAVLLTVTAIGGAILSWRLSGALVQARDAEREGKRKLFKSYASEADATLASGQSGQRFGTLRRVRDALDLSREIGLRDEDHLRLRNIAITALCKPDVEVGLEWPARPDQPLPEGLDPDLRCFALAQNALERLPPPAHMLRGPSWYSPDGRFVAVGLQPYLEPMRAQVPVRVWQIDGSVPRRLLEDSEGPNEYATAFRPDSRQVAFGHADGTVNIYDTETGQMVRRLAASRGGIHFLAYHPRLPRLAAVNYDREVIVWDVDTWQILLKQRPPGGGAWTMAWHPRGHRLATDDGQGGIHLLDAETGKVLSDSWRGPYPLSGMSLTFDHAGDCVATSDWNGMLRLWDPATGRLLFSFHGAPDLHFGSDDQSLGLRRVGGKHQVLRVAGGQELRIIRRPTQQQTERYIDWALHPDGRLLAVTTAAGLGFMDLLTGEEVQFVPGNFRYLGFEQTGALWTCSSAGFFRWPVRSSVGAAHRLRIGPPEWVANAQPGMKGSFSADGRVAGVPMHNAGALVVHRGASRRTVRLGPQYDVRGALPSLDGHWIVTGSHWYDNSGVKIKLWDADTGRLVANLPYPDVTNYYGFSPDSKWIYVSGKEDRRLEIASLAATPFQADASGPARWSEGWRSELAKSDGVFSPDERVRALPTEEGILRLVSPETGQEIARLPSPEVGTLQSPAFSADGTVLAVRGLESGSLYVFDLRRIREQLADLGLDWTETQPALPARTGDDNPALAPPLQVELVDAEWATSHEKMNQYETQRAAVRLFVNPFDADAHYRLGGLQIESGQFAEARAHLTAALAFRPDLDNAYSLRAEAAFRLRFWADAAADATAYLKKYPYDPLVRQFRAAANRGRKHFDEAAADLTAVIESNPQVPQMYDQRADCYDALGKADLAMADREKARKLEATDPRWLNNQAWDLVTGPAAQRDPAKALAIIQRAVKVRSDDATLLNTLGVVQYRNAKYAEALAALEKSLAQSEGKTDAFDLFFLAMCHQKLGHATQAKDCFDRAVLWTPQHQGHLSADQVAQLADFRAEAESVLNQP